MSYPGGKVVKTLGVEVDFVCSSRRAESSALFLLVNGQADELERQKPVTI